MSVVEGRSAHQTWRGKVYLPHLSRRLPEDLKGNSHHRLELGWLWGLSLLELLQHAEQASAQSAGAMRPNRID